MANFSVWEIAELVTSEIDKRMESLRFVDFGDVKAIYALDNGGYTAEVLLPGATTTTIPLNCVNNYIPKVGDWAVVLYPPGTDPLLIGAAPVRTNVVTNPENEFAPIVHNHDGVYAKLGHNHDERYYTKDESVSLWEPKGKLHDDRYYTETEMDVKLATKANTTLEDWQVPTLENGWTIYGPTFSQPGFYKDPLGRVHIRGVVALGTIGQTIFTLPAGYRPLSTVLIFVAIANNAFARVTIYTDGRVVAAVGSNVWFSLDGISFRP